MSQRISSSYALVISRRKGSVIETVHTSQEDVQFDLIIGTSNMPSRLERATIVSPRRVNKGAFEEFKSRLHEVVPAMRNLSDEDIESIKDERNTDVFDTS